MADNLELAARIRAARNYARIKQKDMAKKLSVSIETYGRIEAGTRPASDEELAIISEACTPEVPPWFIRQGWLGGITNPETMAGIFRRQGDENRVPSTMEARNAEGESLGIVDLKLLAAEERIYDRAGWGVRRWALGCNRHASRTSRIALGRLYQQSRRSVTRPSVPAA